MWLFSKKKKKIDLPQNPRGKSNKLEKVVVGVAVAGVLGWFLTRNKSKHEREQENAKEYDNILSSTSNQDQNQDQDQDQDRDQEQEQEQENKTS